VRSEQADWKAECTGAPTIMTEAMRAAEEAVGSIASDPSLVAFLLPGIASKAASLLLPCSPTKVPNPALAAALTLLSTTLSAALEPSSLDISTRVKQHSLQTDAPFTANSGPQGTSDVLTCLRNSAAQDRNTQRVTSVSSGGGPAPKAAEPASDFTVVRDWQWLQGTCANLCATLSHVMPQLCSHAAASVRSELSRMLVAVLAGVTPALDQALLTLFMSSALYLCLDATPAVSRPCLDLLDQVRTTPYPLHGTAPPPAALSPSAMRLKLKEDTRAALEAAIERLLPDALTAFSSALCKPESEVVASARRLTACLRGLPPHRAAALVMLNPARLQRYTAAVSQYMQVDESVASLWLQGHTEPGRLRVRLSRVNHEHEQDPNRSGGAPHPSPGIPRHDAFPTSSACRGTCTKRAKYATVTPSTIGALAQDLHASPTARPESPTQQDSTAAAKHEQQHTVVHAYVPRSMPLGLKYVLTEVVYEAIAAVPRSLGVACAAAQRIEECSGSAVALVDELRRSVEECDGGCTGSAALSNAGASTDLLQQIEPLATLREVLCGFAQGLSQLSLAPVVTASANACKAREGWLDENGQRGTGSGVADSPSSAYSPSSAMARLMVQADAAMASDFAATWDDAVRETQTRAGSGVDLDWLADPLDVSSEGSETGSVEKRGVASSGEGDRQGREGVAVQHFWWALCPGLRSILQSAVKVRPLPPE
jgi:hypothetical protein